MSSAATPQSPPDVLAQRTVQRINRRLMPFLFLLYIVAYLDRVNVSYAGLGMTRELGLSNTQFGVGSGLFFIGYVLLEIPGTILVELWSARKWIARIMITWGLVAALTGFIHSARQFYWARFILGVAEAGFFPGVIVYLTHWYRNADRAKAVAMFMSAIPLSQIVGAPLSAFLMNINWLGLSGWRWLLILEGLPAVLLGIATLFYLTDRPKHAHWLPDDERNWIIGELEGEKRLKAASAQLSVWRALSNPNVVLLTAAYLCGSITQYGFLLWLPKMLQSLSGLGTFKVTMISAIPFLCAWPAMLLIGFSSDRTQERRWHTAGPLVLSGAALGLLQLAGNNVVLIVGLFCLAAIGVNGRLPAFWALPTAFLGGTSAAACIGAINCIGNLGGFFGPSIVGWISSVTGSYTGGVLALVGTAALGVIALILVKPAGRRLPQSGAVDHLGRPGPP